MIQKQKEYFKKYLLNNNNIKNTSLKAISISIDGKEFVKNVSDLYGYEITNVFLPNEISDALKKKIIQQKTSVYSRKE